MNSIEPSPETKLKLFARVDADLAARQSADTQNAVAFAHTASLPKRARGLQMWFVLATMLVLALLVVLMSLLLKM